MWPQIIIFLISTAITIATMPKPTKPKAALLGDIEVPTAEEGVPLPIVFGTVNVRSANVMWNGDFLSRPIKG